GQGALLFIDEPSANSAAGTDDEGSNNRLKVDQGQEEKRKARSRSRKRKNKKNRNVSRSPAVIIDEGIVISSSSSVSTPKDAPSVNGDVPAIPQPIQFPKRLSPPRSNVSSLSSSLKEAKAMFPHLSIDTTNHSSKLMQQLSLHAGEVVSIDGHSGESYEVQLESDFVSPDVRDRSPISEKNTNGEEA